MSDPARTRPLVMGAAFAVAAGLALVLASPPFEVPVLSLLTAPLLVLALERAATLRAAFLLGLASGVTTSAVALGWTIGLLERFAHFPTPLAVLVATLLFVAEGLPYGAALWLSRLLVRGLPPDRAVALGHLAVPLSIVASCTLVPTLFPLRIAPTMLGVLPLAQLAELGGEPLVDLLATLPSCLLLLGLRRALTGPARSVRLAGPALVGATLFALAFAFGALRLESVERARADAPSLRVGVVQPNVGIREKHDPALAPFQLATLHEMTDALARRGAELVVWPETAYPLRFPRDRATDFVDRRRVRGEVPVPILFGAVTTLGGCHRWNSVLGLDEAGRVTGIADKVVLLAFGEFIPLYEYLPMLHARFPCPGLRRGAGATPVSLADSRVGVLNCYEDVVDGVARDVVQAGARFLVNATNDAWFGDTSEPHLHQFVARMRAIETRRDLVRAVNTGVSSHVAATGRTIHATGTFVPASFVADVRLLADDDRGGPTPFVRLGDVTTPAVAFGLALLAVHARRRKQPAPRGGAA